MASKVFIDANLLFDLTLNRKNAEAARRVFELSINGTIRLYTTSSVLHITAYFTGQQYTSSQTKTILLTLLNDVEIIDSDHVTALTALNSNIDDIEDALQYFTALKFSLDYFISSDKKLRKAALPQLPVYTAVEFLKELE